MNNTTPVKSGVWSKIKGSFQDLGKLLGGNKSAKVASAPAAVEKISTTAQVEMTNSERKGRGTLEKRFSFLNRNKTAVDTEKKSGEQKRLEEAQKLYEAGLASVKDLIAPSSMKVDYDKLMINDVYVRTYVVFA